MSAVSEASTEDEPVERDETTADCECCLCCCYVPCAISMAGGPCDRLACVREGDGADD